MTTLTSDPHAAIAAHLATARSLVAGWSKAGSKVDKARWHDADEAFLKAAWVADRYDRSHPDDPQLPTVLVRWAMFANTYEEFLQSKKTTTMPLELF